MATQKNNYLPFLMWFFPLVFFAYQFILRLWPGLMMHQIMDQFSIDASQFGIVAAFYYYGYAGLQIPVAIMLDRFGTKYILFVFASLCGVATLLFTYSHHWYVACFSRFLVGAGSAVGFLGVSKVISEWFPTQQYTKMVGFSFTIGIMGAIYGGKPISLLIETYHWKNVALTLSIVAIMIGIAAYVVMRSPPNRGDDEPRPEPFKMAHVKALLCSTDIWLLALAGFLMVGALEGFSDVWGVPYLMTAYSISKNNAAELISFVFFGMLFGGPLSALISKKLGNYSVIALCGIGMTMAFAVLLLSRHVEWWTLSILFFLIGLMCSYQVIVFSAGSALVKSNYLGITIAFLNSINMLGGSFFHTAIGKIMDLFWTGGMSPEGVRLYSLLAYQKALALIPVSACIGALIVCYLGLKAHRHNKLQT